MTKKTMDVIPKSITAMTARDYLNDNNFCEFVSMFADNTIKNDRYTAQVHDVHYPQKTIRTINIYTKDSIFLLGQVELDLTNKIVTIYEQHNYVASRAMAQLFIDKYGYKLSIYPRTTL